MSEQGLPTPPAPVPPSQGVPPVTAPPVPAPSGIAPAQAPRRSRAGLWWTLGILLALGLVVTSCVLPIALLMGDSSSFDLDTGDAVAVIDFDGVIAGTGDYYSGYITPTYFFDIIDEAEEDDDVKAIVLRVDCPGGTVAASEEIARYVSQCEKPVVVSTGDVNASGAYMVSSQADEVWALPGSAVGSIGVIAEIPNASALLDKLGLEFQVITAGKNKDAGSVYRPLTKEERALIQGEVDEVYEQFIDIVAEGRGLERSEVESMATGWAWNGERAKEMGLVDKIGTYEDALDSAAKLGGIEGDYDIVTYDDQIEGLLGSLLGLSANVEKLTRSGRTVSGDALAPVVPR